MKKILSFLLMVVFLQNISVAQEYSSETASGDTSTIRYMTPSFMGIPIDGTKDWFENQLIEKRGFVKNKDGYLYGKFNGDDVCLIVFENKTKHLVSLVRVSYYPYFYSSAQSFIRKHNDLFIAYSQSKKYKHIKGNILNYSDLRTIINNPFNLSDTGDVLAELDYFSFVSRVEDGITYVYNGCVTIEMVFFSAELYGMKTDKYNLFLNYYNLENAYDNSDL